MDADRDTCRSCMGTGIGNPNVERSACSACNGRGVIRPERPPADEDRWAWNHFEPEPGYEDEQYKSWLQVSAGAADSHAAQAPRWCDFVAEERRKVLAAHGVTLPDGAQQ